MCGEEYRVQGEGCIHKMFVKNVQESQLSSWPARDGQSLLLPERVWRDAVLVVGSTGHSLTDRPCWRIMCAARL